MKRPILVAMILVCLCACAPDPAAQDASTATAKAMTPAAAQAPPAPTIAAVEPTVAALVLPGPFAPDTSLATLQSRLGAGNVQRGEVPGAEGETSDGVILYPGDPTRRAYLYYQDAQTLTGLSTIRVFDEGSLWRMDDGIQIGTSLEDLVQRNGKPIRYYGMEWDYGGTITSWNDGKLAQAKDNPVFRSIRLGPVEGAADGSYPSGDGEFDSNDPKFPRQGQSIAVGEIGISLSWRRRSITGAM